jgi:chemotaxis protein methyltransferase CheR
LVGSPQESKKAFQLPVEASVPAFESVMPQHPEPVASVPAPSPTRDAPPPASEDEREQDPVERARELLDYGHSEEARELLLEVAQQHTDSVPLCTLLGQACANLNLQDEAERWCKQAITLDRLAIEAYYTLALVYQHKGELDLAIDMMKKVVYIDRNSVLGHYGLADLYRARGRLPQALKSLDNARRLLSARPEQDLVPGSGGITVGRLHQAIVSQQQQWEAEAER